MDDDEIIHKCLLSNPPLYEELYKMLNQARADERTKIKCECCKRRFPTLCIECHNEASESLGSGEFKEASPQTKPEKRKKKVTP